MDRKPAFALLAVVIILFIVGVSCNATHSNDKSDKPVGPGWAESLSHVFVKQATADDLLLISGPCGAGGGSLSVTKGGPPCTFQVRDRRRVKLTVTSGSVDTITVIQNGVGGKQNPKTDQTYEFTLDKRDRQKSLDKEDHFDIGCSSLSPTTCILSLNS